MCYLNSFEVFLINQSIVGHLTYPNLALSHSFHGNISEREGVHFLFLSGSTKSILFIHQTGEFQCGMRQLSMEGDFSKALHCNLKYFFFRCLRDYIAHHFNASLGRIKLRFS